MQMGSRQPESRREFFRHCGRAGAFSALAAVCGILIARRNEDCINLGVCSGCRLFKTCGLPDAVAAKTKAKDG